MVIIKAPNTKKTQLQCKQHNYIETNVVNNMTQYYKQLNYYANVTTL